MQTTTNYNLKKPDYTDFADIQDINDNMDTIDGELAAPTGDLRDGTVSFTDADLDSGITSFPTFLAKIVSGMKLAKFIRDFKAGMAYVLHTGSLINNGNCTESGKYALDAAYGKTLADGITSLNSSLLAERKRHFHFTNVDAPAGYKAVQIFFNATATSPILIQDDGGNCLVVLEDWGSVSSLKDAYVLWINKNASWKILNSVFCAKSSEGVYRIKLSYRDSIGVGAFLSLDGNATFNSQQFVIE